MTTPLVPPIEILVQHPLRGEPGFDPAQVAVSQLRVEKRPDWWRIHVEIRGRAGGSIVVPAEDGPAFVSRLHPAEARVLVDGAVMEQQLSFLVTHHDVHCRCDGRAALFRETVGQLLAAIRRLPRRTP